MTYRSGSLWVIGCCEPVDQPGGPAPIRWILEEVLLERTARLRARCLRLDAEFTAISALFSTQLCANAGKAPRPGRHSRIAVTSPSLASWARSSRWHHGGSFSLHTVPCRCAHPGTAGRVDRSKAKPSPHAVGADQQDGKSAQRGDRANVAFEAHRHRTRTRGCGCWETAGDLCDTAGACGSGAGCLRASRPCAFPSAYA